MILKYPRIISIVFVLLIEFNSSQNINFNKIGTYINKKCLTVLSRLNNRDDQQDIDNDIYKNKRSDIDQNAHDQKLQNSESEIIN